MKFHLGRTFRLVCLGFTCSGTLLPAALLAAPSTSAALEAPALLGMADQTAPVHYDFGSQSALASLPVVHTFRLHNGGAAPLTVTRLQASCGCTTAVLTGRVRASGQEVAAALPVVLSPGETASVHISIDPAHLLPGTVSKDVWVYIQGQATPAATLEIDGTIVPAAAFSPATLDFSRTPADKAPVLALTVTLDPHAFAALGPPRHPVLVSSSPDILVSEAFSSKREAADSAVTETYQIRLTPKARLGVLNERLTLFASQADQSVGRSIPGASLPVLGEVTGEISASPQTIVFGMVSAVHGGVQRVMLTASSASALRGLALFSASPAVTVRLLNADKQPGANGSSPKEIANGSSAEEMLEVTVTPRRPGQAPLVGTLQTQVLVTTAGGQQLVLPLFVSVAD